MGNLPDITVLVLSVAFSAAGWLMPFAGATFVVAGSIPLYALLHLLEVSPTGTAAGAVVASVGMGSLVRLSMSRDRPFDGKGRLRMALLFGAFVAFWYLRWLQSPPDPPLGASDFGSKAPAFMIFLAIIPFLSGILARGPEDLRALMVCLARWGMASLLVIGIYWITGQPSQSTHPLENWQPIPSLNVVYQAFDLGLGVLANLIVLESRREIPWQVMKALMVIAAAGLMILIGQRGPFLFFAIALLLRAFLASRRLHLRHWLIAAGVAGVLGVAALSAFGGNRVLSLSNYTAAGNANRLFILRMAAHHFEEHPLTGWGGGMVGKPVNLPSPFDPYPWDYVHNVMLDPLLETGLVGATLFWLLFGILLLRSVRGLRRESRVADEVRVLLPLLAYIFAESQVSGHLSAARHFWMATGVMVAVLARTGWRCSDQTTLQAPTAGGGRLGGGPIEDRAPSPDR